MILSTQAFHTPKSFISKYPYSIIHMNADRDCDELNNVGVVLLAGGKGKRMKSSIPKQFLPLLGKPVFLRSLDIFTGLKYVTNIVIVLDESYRDEYDHIVKADSRISWADPGAERQDSVFNGLQNIPDTCRIVAIHDAARPLVTKTEVETVLMDGIKHGAAVLGVPMKATVKESEDGNFVLRTIQRSRLWEIHTPQVSILETKYSVQLLFFVLFCF
jgi:2-C-methyl-D-erythritol 4-phosphate cytidylyltransferase